MFILVEIPLSPSNGKEDGWEKRIDPVTSQRYIYTYMYTMILITVDKLM